jgi:GT2 family glycosyltransferase
MDNGGTDGSPAAIREKYGDKVHVIENGANLHFAKGNIPGIHYAVEQKCDYMVLLNDDVILDPQMISKLVEVAESDKNIGVVGPKIYYENPPDQLWYAGGIVYLYRGTAKHIGIREKDRGQYDNQRDVDYITGCALMIKREVVEKIGPLSSEFVIYWEDADWCLRAKNAGYRIVYVPVAKMWHKISASHGGQLSKYKLRNKLRSLMIFLRRHTKWYHWLTIPFFFTADAIRILFMMATGRFKKPSA